MRGHKPQKGNQFGGHAGPYNMNSAPLTTNVPFKRDHAYSYKQDAFFKPAAPILGNIRVEQELVVTCLLSLMNGPK